jgi:hypothetical protein
MFPSDTNEMRLQGAGYFYRGVRLNRSDTTGSFHPLADVIMSSSDDGDEQPKLFQAARRL